jgi:uncharacterized membrane protein YGL010W
MHPLLGDYAQYHRDPRNRVMHEIGIPLIVLGVAALMRLAHVGNLDLALLAIVATSIFYIRLVGTLAIPAILGLFALYVLALFIAWPWAIAVFFAGWVFQFIGHAYEGKSPAFLTNLVHLLIGPLWIGVILTHREA